MLNALVVLATLACVPDTVTYWPTPTFRWDHPMTNTLGYRAYWSDPTVMPRVWNACPDLPMWTNEDGTSFRWGQAVQYPIQRCVDAQEVLLEWAVRAYNAAEESVNSNVVPVCMPHIWHPGEAYQ